MAIQNITLTPVRGYVEDEVNGRRVYKNVETGETLPPGVTPSPTPTISDLLAENVSLKQTNQQLMAQIKAVSDRSDFVEDCIAEMAAVVYSGDDATTTA